MTRCASGCSHDHHGHGDEEMVDNVDMSDAETVDETVCPSLPAEIKKKIITEAPSTETVFPQKGDEVIVHYVGTLHSDGSKFDSSRDRDDYFKFTLGQGQVIKGWDVGVATMKKGEKALFTIPAAFAYGAQGSPPKIPANATLDFEIELFGFSKGETDLFSDGSAIKRIIKASKSYQKPKDGDDVVFSLSIADSVSENHTFTIGSNQSIEGVPSEVLNKTLKDMKSGETAKVVLSRAREGFTICLKEIQKVEDISIEWDSKSVFKKTIRSGQGFQRPTEDSIVTFEINVQDKAGNEILSSTSVSFRVGECQHSEALECAALKMSKGEEAKIFASNSEATSDPSLNYKNELGTVIFAKLVSFDISGKPSYQQTAQEKLINANKHKDIGSKVLAQGRVRLALEKYKAAAKVFEYAQPDEKIDGVQLLMKACRLNQAMCLLKLEEYRKAEEVCTKVIKEDVHNVKALYRRAQALSKLGDHNSAVSDLKTILEVDSDNVDAKRLLQEVKDVIKKEEKAQKGLFSKMFRGIAESQNI